MACGFLTEIPRNKTKKQQLKNSEGKYSKTKILYPLPCDQLNVKVKWPFQTEKV